VWAPSSTNGRFAQKDLISFIALKWERDSSREEGERHLQGENLGGTGRVYCWRWGSHFLSAFSGRVEKFRIDKKQDQKEAYSWD